MDIAHQGAQTSSYLADKYPHIEFKQYTLPKYRFDLEIEQEDTDRPYAYILRSVLWTLPDDDCISILQALVPLVEKNPRSSILVNDLMSPKTAYYGLPLDKAFRRRDVTVMTMHNAKVRTCEEWESLFMKACPRFMVCTITLITAWPHTELQFFRCLVMPESLPTVVAGNGSFDSARSPKSLKTPPT